MATIIKVVIKCSELTPKVVCGYSLDAEVRCSDRMTLSRTTMEP
jgi:hypothetical protein